MAPSPARRRCRPLPPLLLLALALALALVPLTSAAGARPCEFDGQQIRHRGAKYLAGRSHKRGSVYAACADGELTCFEDNGIADAPQTRHKQVPCNASSIRARSRQLGVAVHLQEDVWPGGVIWYHINSSFSAAERQTITAAIAVYASTDVNITFKECEPTTLCNNKYVSFEQNEDACYSYVGYVDDGEPQIVNLGESCFDGTGTAVHEIGHALGLYHEHTHPQREVIILTDSDLPVSASNYAKETDAIFKPYDKSSIMHYGRTAGLCLPKDEYPLKSFCDVEITTNCVMPVRQHCNTTKTKTIGQRSVLSAGDLNTLKALYGSKDGKNDSSMPVPIPNGSGSGSTSESDSSGSTDSISFPVPSPVSVVPSPSPTPSSEQPTAAPTPSSQTSTTKEPSSEDPSGPATTAPTSAPEPATASPTTTSEPSPSTSAPPEDESGSVTETPSVPPESTPVPDETVTPAVTTAPESTGPATAAPESGSSSGSDASVGTEKPSAPLATKKPKPSSQSWDPFSPAKIYVPGGVHGDVNPGPSKHSRWWLDWWESMTNGKQKKPGSVDLEHVDLKIVVKKHSKSSEQAKGTQPQKSAPQTGNGWGSYNRGFLFRGAGQ